MADSRLISRGLRIAIGADGSVTEVGGQQLWPFTQSRRRLRRAVKPALLDPFNILVVRCDPERVIDALGSRGWTRPDDGAVHVTWHAGTRRVMSDHTALGTRKARVHVRVFSVAGHTVAAAHHEVADARGHHQVTSWDRARVAVVDALCAAGFVQLSSSAELLPRNLRDVDGDGRIWRLGPPAR